MRLPIGVSDFQELIQGDYIFADKSPLVREILADGAKVILITRPRRFGKTLNLSMLYYFLQMHPVPGGDLFQGLAISADEQFCKRHQNQYPVIFITFKDIKQSNYHEAYKDVEVLIRRLYTAHAYLLEGKVLREHEKTIFTNILNKTADLSDIKSSIQDLSEYLHRKFNKRPILLIDEYDTPIQEAYLKGYYQEMIDLMRSILGMALKDNSCLVKAILTGITRVSQESMFSGVNNIKVYSLLHEKYGQYFGFTEAEVKKLIIASGIAEDNISLIKEWYNGYQIGRYVLYNPWSIINCLTNEGALQPYWVNTASNELIGKLLSDASPNIKHQFAELLQGKVIEQPLAEDLVFLHISTREEALWSLLLYAGYLKVLTSQFRGSRLLAKIAIPNKEVSFVYDRIVEAWFSTAINFESYDKFVHSLIVGDIAKFKIYLSSYIMQSGSYFDFSANTSEQIFHVFILGLVVGLREYYYITSNQESGLGLGRVDVIFIPRFKRTTGILLEFKTSETIELLAAKSQEALQQIKDRQYVAIFNQHNVHSVLAIGMAFCGKQLELAYETLDLCCLRN